MEYETFTKLFESTVAPILDYGTEVLGYVDLPKIDAVQFKTMKAYLGVKKHTPHPMIEGDMGWAPGKIRRMVNRTRFWNRVMKMDEGRLPKSLMEWEIEEENVWSSSLKKEIDELDETENLTWINDRSIADLRYLKGKLMDNYQEQWKVKVNSKPKLRSYKLWKSNFGTEMYVKINLSRGERSMLAQIRGGVAPINLETGRYNRVPVEQRICEMCHLEEVETEEHLLLKCPKYEDLRAELQRGLTPVNWADNNLAIGALMNIAPRATAKFICKVFDRRKAQVFKQ